MDSGESTSISAEFNLPHGHPFHVVPADHHSMSHQDRSFSSVSSGFAMPPGYSSSYAIPQFSSEYKPSAQPSLSPAYGGQSVSPGTNALYRVQEKGENGTKCSNDCKPGDSR